MAVGAERRSLDAFRRHAGGEQLLPVGFHQIKKNLLRQFAVPGSAGGQEQKGIFLAHRIGFLQFAKQSGRIPKLRFKLDANFFSDLIAAALNPRTNRSLQVTRAAAEVAMHFADAFFYDTLHRASPSGVKHAYGVPFGVHQNHREAVRGLNGEEQAGSAGNESIAGQRLARRRVYAVNYVGMNLPQCDQRPQRSVSFSSVGSSRTNSWYISTSRTRPLAVRRPNFAQECRPVTLDRRLGVVLGKTKIEIALAVSAREPSLTRGKSMHQPRNFSQLPGAKNVEGGLLGFFPGIPSRHSSMLLDDKVARPKCGGVDAPGRSSCS